MRIKDLKCIGIIGPGLIGGSIGLALKSEGVSAKIIGIGRRKSSIDSAIKIGAIDTGSTNIDDVKDANLVIITTPISTIKSIINDLSYILKPGTVVTDAGSTKRRVCRWGNKLIKRGVQFVGSHPIAGSEKRGVEFARHDLFRNAYCFITPTKEPTKPAIRLVTELWMTLNMRIVLASPEYHDRLLAYISHLPHIIASSLINTAINVEIEYAGTGFLDTTRIASGDMGLWTDIILSNPDNISRAIDRFIRQLTKFKDAIRKKDADKIKNLLKSAKVERDKLVEFKYKQSQIE